MFDREREREVYKKISTFCNKDDTAIYVSIQTPWCAISYLGIDENINERHTDTCLGQIDS